MKKINVLVATAIVAMGMTVTSCDSHKSASLKTAADSVSYAIGISTGAGYKDNLKTLPGDPANVDDLIAGFTQAIKGDSAAMKMTPQAAQAYIQTYFMEASARDAKKNKEEGEKFLAENKGKKGVITTESGLQYQVEKEGTGAKPTAEDKVKVHYTGTLLDGTKFDSSVDRGEPAEFGVGQVIKGWTEVLQLMPVGSKYIIWVPSELAYGERGAQPDIKPNSVLKFEVELLDIVKDSTAAKK
ncbi:FKBP-type peptidyl-prolyl cis-trans isomerase [Parabacteroides sp. APC149_11_2_Y6]